MEQIMQHERMYQKLGETELKASKGKPAGQAQQTQQSITQAMKRIESLENADMTARIALKGPDEIFALNATQNQLDRLVERANDMQARMENVENLTGSMASKEDDKNAIELKAMMSNVKSKFTFLDPKNDQQESKNMAEQVSVMQEQIAKFRQYMTSQE